MSVKSEKCVESSEMVTRANILPIDRGWAWIIVLASSSLFGLTAGGFKVQGVVLLEVTERFPGTTDADNLWLLTVNFILALGLGPLWSFLMTRVQPRYIVMVGITLYCSSYLGLAYATSIPLCFLLYSIPGGIGNGMVILPSLLISRPYFEKRKALAVGLIASGSGLGQVILPFVIRSLFDGLDYKSALTLYAGFAFHFLILASLLRPMSYYEQRYAKELEVAETEASNSSTKQTLTQKSLVTNTSIEEGTSPNIESSHSSLNKDWIVEPRTRSYSMHHKLIKGDNLEKGSHHQSEPGNIHLLVPAKHTSDHEPRPRSRLLTIGSLAGSATFTHIKPECSSKEADPDSTVVITPRFCNRELLANPKLWMLLASLFMYCLGAAVTYQCLPPLANAAGISKETVALLLMVGGLIEAPSRTSNGLIADRGYISTLNQYILCNLVAGIANLICASVSGLAGAIVCILGMSLTGTSVFSLMPIVAEEVLSAEYVHVAMGLFNISQSVSFVVTTPIVGIIFKAFNRWESVFFYISACNLIGALIPVPYSIIKAVRDHRRKQSQRISK